MFQGRYNTRQWRNYRPERCFTSFETLNINVLYWEVKFLPTGAIYPKVDHLLLNSLIAFLFWLFLIVTKFQKIIPFLLFRTQKRGHLRCSSTANLHWLFWVNDKYTFWNLVTFIPICHTSLIFHIQRVTAFIIKPAQPASIIKTSLTYLRNFCVSIQLFDFGTQQKLVVCITFFELISFISFFLSKFS